MIFTMINITSNKAYGQVSNTTFMMMSFFKFESSSSPFSA